MASAPRVPERHALVNTGTSNLGKQNSSPERSRVAISSTGYLIVPSLVVCTLASISFGDFFSTTTRWKVLELDWLRIASVV